MQRIRAGAELTPEERQVIAVILARFGRDGQDIADDLATIEYAIVQYWFVMATIVDDARRRLKASKRLAAELSRTLAELPHHYLAGPADADPEWALLALHPEVLRTLDRPGALFSPDPFPPPLRRQRSVRYESHAGSRLEIAQYVIDRVETWAGEALQQTEPRPGNRFEHELRGLLWALKRIWIQRLGRPFRPRAQKPGNIGEFVAAIVAVADPHLLSATVLSVLRREKANPAPRPRSRNGKE